MAYRRRNRLRRRNARPTTKRAFKRVGRGIKGVTSVAYRRPGYGFGGMGAFGTRLGRVGRQRNAARAAVLMQRRRRRAGTGGGGEIGWVKKRGGKYRGMTLRKLHVLNTNRGTLRFQGVNRMNAVSTGPIDANGNMTLAPPGFFKMSNSPNANTQAFNPLYAFDLTTCPNTSISSNGVCYQIAYDSTLASYTWIARDGQDNLGSASPGYTREDNTSSISSMNSQHIQTDWFDIRAVCYGARTQPTYYDFMIVQFTKDYLHPCNYASTTGFLPAEEAAAQTSFWTSMTKNISFSAILPAARDSMRGLRVLRRFRFTLQPSLTVESDRNPNMRIVKLFQKHYSFDNYNYGKGLASGVTAETIDSARYQTDNNQNIRNHPDERARTYLIIRASNTTEQPVAGETVDNTPSFDLIIRKQVAFPKI